MSSKKIIQRSLDFDLTDQELENLRFDQTIQEETEAAKYASTISTELFLRGYTSLVKIKEEEIRTLLDQKQRLAHDMNTQNSNRSAASPRSNSSIILYKLLGIAAAILLLIVVVTTPWETQERIEVSKELKTLAMLSFESSGLLSGKRGDSEIDNAFKSMYDLLASDHCDEFVPHGNYKEQELWMSLYCAWVSENEFEYNSKKKIIIDNKYSNYKKIESINL